MKVTLLAATGQAGSTILPELYSRGHQVKAVARNISKLSENLPANVQVIENDFTDFSTIEDIIRGSDVVISAFGPYMKDERYHTDISYTDQLVTFTEKVIAAVKSTSVSRLIVVGGAGSLEYSPGVTLLDSGHWPEPYMNIARSHVKAFAALRESGLNWTYFSPAMLIEPGERTENFKLGKDALIFDEEGNSHISFEDYALALVDEIEMPKNERSRFTIGY